MIGLLLNNLNSCHMQDAVDSNQDIYVFYEELSAINYKYPIPCLFLQEAYAFHGPVVCTTFNMAQKMKRLGAATDKILYIDNMEWLENKFGYETYLNIMQDITIIVSNKEIQKVIYNVFNFKPEVMDIKCLLETFSTKSTS